jgi:hypothetical protein
MAVTTHKASNDTRLTTGVYPEPIRCHCNSVYIYLVTKMTLVYQKCVFLAISPIYLTFSVNSCILLKRQQQKG